MKSFFVLAITAYQGILSPIFKLLVGSSSLCKFSPSCSEYTKRMIKKYGVWKGMQLGVTQIVVCR